MSLPEKCDYHVHYHVDGCVNDEMTLANIEREAVRLGLDEICVLKHYSAQLPNNEERWVHWKQIKPEEFTAFMGDIRTYQAFSGLSMLAGVESELVDDQGTINIPSESADLLDAVLLSVHWLPRMQIIDVDPDLIPGNFDESPAEAAAQWRARVQECGPRAIIENFVSAYVQAITHNSKVRVLAHMYDGLLPLRNYEVDADALSDDELADLFKPLMDVCAAHEVLWELTAEPVKRPSILKRADEMGVRFTATADSHFLQVDGWANLRDHDQAEEYIASLGLTKGIVKSIS